MFMQDTNDVTHSNIKDETSMKIDHDQDIEDPLIYASKAKNPNSCYGSREHLYLLYYVM